MIIIKLADKRNVMILKNNVRPHSARIRKIAQSAGAVEIHRLHLCRGARPNERLGYDTEQSDGEVPMMLGLWEKRSTPSLPLLPGPLWLGVVAPDKALSMG